MSPFSSTRPWSATKADHCLLQTLPPLKHTRLDTDLEYAPARDVALPGKSSRRSTVFWIDPIDHAEKICESDLEARHIIQFTSDRRVMRIETQFGPLHYRDADGALRSTVYDGRVSYEDALKTLVSVKVAERAALQGTDEINQRVLDYEPLAVADQAQLLTERDLPAWAASNAALIHSVRNSHHESPDIKGEGFLLQHARALARPVTISELCEPFGGSGQHFRAAVMLLFEGDLRQVNPGLINETTVVVAVVCFPRAFGHRFHEHSATRSTVIRPVCHDGLRGNLKLPILLVLSAKGEGVGKVANEEDRRCIAA